MFARLNINPKLVGTVAFRFFLTGIMIWSSLSKYIEASWVRGLQQACQYQQRRHGDKRSTSRTFRKGNSKLSLLCQ